MNERIYILNCNDVPVLVTHNLKLVQAECRSWMEAHRDMFYIERDFNRWVEDRDYPETEEGEEQAWEDFVDYQMNEGYWGDYQWFEEYVKD